MIINIPWPPSKLSRNGSQGDYKGKARAASTYRSDCLISVLRDVRPEDRRRGIEPGQKDYAMMTITYHPPDRKRRDLDNLLAMTKQGIDAISEVLGVDDSIFQYTLLWGESQPLGRVEIWV